MPRARQLLRRAALAILLAATASCASLRSSSGGGLLSPGGSPIEVRGYALAPEQKVPADAVGYAVPIFTTKEQAQRFCPLLTSRLTFNGSMDASVKMLVRSYGQTVEVAPFVWPVSAWSAGQSGDCSTLVERYNVSAARTFYARATAEIQARGGGPAQAMGAGPYIMLVRRISGTVMLFDLSRAPADDYPRWLDKAIAQLGNPAVGGTGYVATSMRDNVRFYVFGAVPTFTGILNVLIPGYKSEHDKG